MKRFFLPLRNVLSLGFFLAAGALAYGEYFYTDDPEFLALTHISRRMGRTLPFSSFPVHGGDLLDYAEELLALPGAETLDEADRLMLGELIAGLGEPRDRGIRIQGSLTLAYEHRLQTGSFTIDGEEVPNGEDFRRAFLNFSPVLSLRAGAGVFDGPWIAGELNFRPPWEGDYAPSSNFFSKVDISYDILKRGILAWNGRYLNFFLGRDTVHWGNPRGATFYPSALLPYLDSLRLNVPLGPFSFDYLLGAIIPRKAPRDVYDVNYDPNPPAPGKPYTDYFGFLHDPNPSTILAAAHRLQWNFGPLKAGIGGTVVYVRSNNAFHITDVLPVMIYHNADLTPNNLSLIVDLSWTVLPGLDLSAMAGFDDISARIFGIPDGDTPTIPAAVLQLEYSAAADALTQYYMLEGGYTHYLWGNYAFDDPPFTQSEARLARALYRYTANKNAALLPLTSPYGPGTIWGRFLGNFRFPRRHIRAGIEMLFLVKNSEVNLVDIPYESNEGLAGYDRWFFALDLPLTYTWKNLDVSLKPSLLWGTGGRALECTLGLKWTLGGAGYLSPLRRSYPL
ncbi:MAG: hypothetical protein LBE02_01065 [Spirochaetaceae bacterium]|jgi:hypothetical protein|nr:hypothetical protein [Spirochaetaceae bacterium]